MDSSQFRSVADQDRYFQYMDEMSDISQEGENKIGTMPLCSLVNELREKYKSSYQRFKHGKKSKISDQA